MQLRAYLLKLQQRLCLASAWGDDAEADWIAIVWRPGMQLQDLQSIEKRFVSLARKLASELYNTCPLKVRMRIDDFNMRLQLENAMLNGPQVLWIIIDSFQYDDLRK